MDRRELLGLVTIPALVGLSGCAESVHRFRGPDTPAELSVGNATDESHQITLRIDRDGEVVFDAVVDVGENGAVESLEGTEYDDAEFSRAGTYTLAAEGNGEETRSEAELSWRDLTDCNSNTLQVIIFDDELDAGLVRTDVDCGGLDRLGGG